MSNGSRIYEHAINQVYVRLIPLKWHPKRFLRKTENLIKLIIIIIINDIV